jgi:hypothetical protein
MNGFRGLLGAELRRFFSRRLVRAAFAFGIALSTLVLVIQAGRSDVSTASQQHTTFVCSSPSGPATVSPTFGTVPQDCVPQLGTSTVERDRRMRVHDTFSDTVKGTGFAMVFLAFVIGASFVGAEFGAGSLSTQLLFEPRRVRVVVVKAIAVGIALVVLSVALLLYIGFLQWAGSSLRGVVNGLDGAWFAARAGDIARVAAATALAGIAAYAITILARRTVAAVAGLLIVGWASAIIGHFKAWRWVARYNPATAVFELVADEHRRPGTDVLLPVRSAVLCSCLWAVALTLVAAAIFARREVR